MFYEGLGVLLRRGGDVLGDVVTDAGDERGQRQLRMLATLMRRAGVVMPMMFAALDEELAVLTAARDDLHRSVAALGAALPAPADEPAAPLDVLRRLWAEIDEATVALHALDPHDATVVAARRRLREGLAAAAAIEGRLVDAMLAA